MPGIELDPEVRAAASAPVAEQLRKKEEAKQQKIRDRVLAERIQARRQAELFASMDTPVKDPKELTPQPPGPPETWPIAFLPDGEDVCGNGHVLKKQTKPGNAELGPPPATAKVQILYTAYTMDGTDWDSSQDSYSSETTLGFRLGDLWVSHFLEAAAAALEWGEEATFVCTCVYAKLNNATKNKTPEGACFKFDVKLVWWRAPMHRDLCLSQKSAYDITNEERLEEVYKLKAQAQPLMKHGEVAIAREIYFDGIWYLENLDNRTDGMNFLPPEGREEEGKSLLISLYLNDAFCTLKLCDKRREDGGTTIPSEYRRVEDRCSKAIDLDKECVKGYYRRGIARTFLHDHAEAGQDLIKAAKLDPKSREIRAAIDELKKAIEEAKKNDGMLAGKALGHKKGPIPRAPPGGGLKQPATVWLELALGGVSVGRVTIQLLYDAPRTVENFRCLCTGERGMGESGVPLHYKGSVFHRLCPGFILQGGDIVHGTGFGGDSIYGRRFRDERFLHKHDRRGLVSMANSGPDTNQSQFFLTLAAAPHLDGLSVCFGEVIDGIEVLDKLERVPVDNEDKPLEEISIRDCGEVPKSSLAPPMPDGTPGAAGEGEGNELALEENVTGAEGATQQEAAFAEAAFASDEGLANLLSELGLERMQSTLDDEEMTLALLLAMAPAELKTSLLELGLVSVDVEALSSAIEKQRGGSAAPKEVQ